jgi:serine/threonine protein kinase
MSVDQEPELGKLAERSIAGRYRLVRPLGEGGMGRVWLARDEMLRRDVAVKELVPSPGLGSDQQRELRERSIREARAIARLNHPNVVRIFDVLHADGEPWIVMEFVPSRSLQQVLSEHGPVAPAEAARIGLAVLAGLRAAHRVGLLHRDVKPANVLLADDGRVVLTDFGLATAPDDPSMTQTGVVLGSPSYLAPERAFDGVVGPAADLWSLGATLYTAVEGRPPYARASTLATLAALTTEPPAPAVRAGAMAPALEGLLRKDPSRRVGAEEAETLLRQAAAGQPASSATAPPVTLEMPLAQGPAPQPLDASAPVAALLTGAGSATRRGRRLVLVAGVVAVVLLAGGLAAHRLGTWPKSGDPVQHSGIGLVPLPVSSASGTVPSPSAPPSPSPTASPTRHSTAPASTKAGAPSSTSQPQPPTTAIVTATGVISHGGGSWCADISPKHTVQLWDCNHSGPQTWSVHSDGRLSALGDTVCMTPVNDGRTVGTAIGVSSCSGTDNAQTWRQTNSTIVNTASGLCLSPGTFGYTSPFALQTCNSDSMQQWDLPTSA